MDNTVISYNTPLDILLHIEDVPAPVEITDAYFEKSEGAAPVIKIKIQRDLAIKLKSVTVSFCFEPEHMPSGKLRRVTDVVCSSPALNTRESSTISVNAPGNLSILGGCVYISAVRYDSDLVMNYTPVGLDRYVRGIRFTSSSSAPSPAPKPDPVNEDSYDDYAPKGPYSPDDNLDSYVPTDNDIPKPVRRGRALRWIIASVCILVMGASVGIGAMLVSRGQTVEDVAEKLVVENRYNEAYKIVSDTMYKGVLQRVCESASSYYVSKGDFCTAYVYAKAAPSPYEDAVINEAKAALLSAETNALINENALIAVHQIKDGDKFDSLISSLAEVLCTERKYGVAMAMAGEIRSADTRNRVASVIFTDGIKYYMDNGLYENVGELIDAFGYHEDVVGKLNEYCTSVGISINSLIEDCYSNGGSAAAIILSNYLDQSYSHIPINAGDPSIRRNLSTVYPMLTADQKRAYHAKRFSLYKEAYLVLGDGTIPGTNISNAVSVDAGEYQTIVLNSSGNVISIDNDGHNLVIPIPEQINAVQIAAGQKHLVLLDNNGTVKAYGDNTFGQCNTSEWTDIIAVAAGANFTAGLKSDGTLVACGSNMSSQCDVSSYVGAVDIDAMDQTLVILFADGTVAVRGDISLGIKNADSFTNVKRISAGDGCIVAETNDGKFLMASGIVKGSCGSVDTWKDVRLFSAGSACAAYVNAQGNIIYTGDGAPNH